MKFKVKEPLLENPRVRYYPANAKKERLVYPTENKLGLRELNFRPDLNDVDVHFSWKWLDDAVRMVFK